MESCLDSIRQQKGIDYEIIVFDNSCDPAFSKSISAKYPEVKLYSNRRNLFYCEPMNKGIEVSCGEFVACLNDDVRLDRMFIEKALEAFGGNEKIGMVSGKVLRNDGITLDSTGLFLSIWMSAKDRGYGKKDRGQFDKKGYIFGVNGAVAFYRRKMLEETKDKRGYFDNRFRFFYEDLDIGWRAQKAGWKGYYLPEAIAYHVRGGTARDKEGIDKKYARRYLSDELYFYLVRNRYLTIMKNAAFLEVFLHLPFIIVYEIFTWLHILFFRPSLIKLFFRNE